MMVAAVPRGRPRGGGLSRARAAGPRGVPGRVPCGGPGPDPRGRRGPAAAAAGPAATAEAQVHPSACVAAGAELGAGAVVGPFCIVGEGVTVGAGCRLHGHNVVLGDTALGAGTELLHGAVVGSEDPGAVVVGANNRIGHHAVVGVRCQDLKYAAGTECHLSVGDGNDIREHASIHRSSMASEWTRVGNGNLFMGATHAAHDVQVGDGCIVANGALLAGHVVLGDRVVVGGAAAVQQRCHLGSYCHVAGGAMVEADVPPFLRAQGDRARIRGVNEILLRRCGFTEDEIAAVKDAYKALWLSRDAPKDTRAAAAALRESGRFAGRVRAQELLEAICESFAPEEGAAFRTGGIIPR